MKYQIGDKVKILWEKTPYCSTNYYANKGEIVYVYDNGNYDVSGFSTTDYTLTFKEDELILLEEENKMNTQEILNLLGKKAYIVVKDENGEAQKEFEEFFYKNAQDEKDNQSITEEEKNQFTFYKRHIIGEVTIRKIEFDNEPKPDNFNLKTYIITYFFYYGRYGKTRKHNIVELNELNKTWFLSKDDAINYIDEIANDRVIV